MNRQKWIFLTIALFLIAGTAGLLGELRAHQKLGLPGVKTSAVSDPRRLAVELPIRVLDYQSAPVEMTEIELKTLPEDTSFGRRRYIAPDGFWTEASVVLMGYDRTSLHKTEFCLEGQGWRIDHAISEETTVHMDRPQSYDLPVMKFIANKEVTFNGQNLNLRAVYVYWFVSSDKYTARHGQRMWWMAKDLLRTGVLQRWAAVSYFSVCEPGQEEATFNRMKKFIVASVPEFQLIPGSTVSDSIGSGGNAERGTKDGNAHGVANSEPSSARLKDTRTASAVVAP
jgi:hypothetical protein